METLDDQNFSDENLLNAQSVKYLETTAKWANFLAIIGFISVGFIILAGLIGLVTGSFYSSMTMRGRGMYSGSMMMFGSFLPVIYFVFAALYFFPALYTFRFAKKIKEAVYDVKPMTYENGFKNLKSLFKFIGILTIVMIASYILMIPLILIFAAI